MLNQQLKQMEQRRKPSIKRDKDTRDEWSRDLTRIIHSPAYRRLQSKTQVLGLGESDFYRTRLTHSMEVAQISLGIKGYLRGKVGGKDNNQGFTKKLLPASDLIVSTGLAHDLGHPPFGHGGEVALNYCMRNYGGFEGNAQTLRIISKLEKYQPKGCGLNPTRRLLLGVLKYPAYYESVVNEDLYKEGLAVSPGSQKPNWLFKDDFFKPPKCIYSTEKDVLEFVLMPFSDSDKELFLTVSDKPGKHSKSIYKSLDTSIMELGDDIAYGVHDLEDAISLKMITREVWEEYFSVDNRKEIIQRCHLDGGALKYSYADLTDYLFGESYSRKEAIGSLVHALMTSVEIEDLNNRANVKFKHPLLRYNAVLEKEYKKLLDVLQKLVVEKVIKHPNVQMLEFKGQKMVVELFELIATDAERFLQGEDKTNWRSAKNDRDKYRIICDYIAGMTDDYAVRLYQKLFMPNYGSIFDHL